MASGFTLGGARIAKVFTKELPLVPFAPGVSRLTLSLADMKNIFCLFAKVENGTGDVDSSAAFALPSSPALAGCSVDQWFGQYNALAAGDGITPFFQQFDLSNYLATSGAVYDFDTSGVFVPVKIYLYCYTYL